LVVKVDRSAVLNLVQAMLTKSLPNQHERASIHQYATILAKKGMDGIFSRHSSQFRTKMQ
jgi:hypothetical protein